MDGLAAQALRKERYKAAVGTMGQEHHKPGGNI